MSGEQDIRAVWAEELRAERARRRLDQAAVAEMSGLDQTTISYLEHGKGSVNSFDAAARALGISLQPVGATEVAS